MSSRRPSAPSGNKAALPRYWLFKVPKYISKHWRDDKKYRKGALMAEILADTSKEKHGLPKLTLTLPEMPGGDAELTGLPLEYDARVRPSTEGGGGGGASSAAKGTKKPPQIVFTSDDQNQCRITGFVMMSADVRPVNNERLRNYLRETSRRAELPQQTIEIKDDQARSTAVRQREAENEREARQARERRTNARPERRERGSREQVRKEILKLFDRKSAYTLKELVSRVNQPQQFVKEIVRQVADYQSVDQRWQLKPRFRLATDSAIDRSAGAAGSGPGSAPASQDPAAARRLNRQARF